jgi:hypothetical protein
MNYIILLKNFLSKKILIGLIFFLVGLILGYVLGFFKFHQYIINDTLKFNIDFSWLNWFGQMAPNPEFLSDIAAFEAVIIAFLVPLSIEIISKLSERYNSDVITRSFENNFKNRTLPPLLLINIVVAIILRFFIKDQTNPTALNILAWIVLLIFMYTAYAIWTVINRIKTFISDTQYVINQLYEDVKKSIK